MNPAGQSLPHESATGHVTGKALYTDDLLARFPNLLHARPVLAPHAHAELISLDSASALEAPGVVTVLTAADVPGAGDTGPADRATGRGDAVQHGGRHGTANDCNAAAAATRAVAQSIASICGDRAASGD